MPIHDHFDGSSNCVECGGPCTLTGDSLHLTRLVRHLLASRVVRDGRAWIGDAVRLTIAEAGGDPDRLARRAEETLPSFMARRG
jgi:hypothetical protein